MTPPPYWTAADAAELDLLVAEFTRAYYAHRDRCPTCDGPRWCQQLEDAFDVVLEWRRLRMLRSRATYLRLREELTELERLIARRGNAPDRPQVLRREVLAA